MIECPAIYARTFLELFKNLEPVSRRYEATCNDAADHRASTCLEFGA
jgi:hypothetical protein